MSIGITIKQLRRGKDMTQEQLAEYLGITSRAVSQWECDRTTPDISLLPSLCHIFNVSSDVLLGIDIDKNNEEIEKYLFDANELIKKSKFDQCTMLLRDAHKKFPLNYKIMVRLADAIVSEYSRKGIKNYEEVFDICKRIISECTDSNIRYEALETLGVAYNYSGKTDEMEKLIMEMPKARFSYENFMVYRWEGSDAVKERQNYINFLLHELLSMISCLSSHLDNEGKMIHSIKERKELKKLELDLIELFFPESDYHYFASYAEMVCSFFVSVAYKENDTEKIWFWLNKGADFAIHFDTYDFNQQHSSPILKGYSSGGWIMEDGCNHTQIMIDWLTTDNEALILSSDKRYDDLINRLKSVAKKI